MERESTEEEEQEQEQEAQSAADGRCRWNRNRKGGRATEKKTKQAQVFHTRLTEMTCSEKDDCSGIGLEFESVRM